MSDGSLRDLISMLRLDRDRSAWSRSQTFEESLVKLRGEIDECLEALRAGDETSVTEELGDVLWSLIFAMIVAEGEVGLPLDRVAAAAIGKLRGRKPWLFEDGSALTLEQEDLLWRRAKQREKGFPGAEISDS